MGAKNKAVPVCLGLVVMAAIIGCVADVQAQITADHNAVRQFEQIPDTWIQAAKNLTFHYAHTSHGSQIVAGLLALERIDPKYGFAVNEEAETAALPPQENPPVLRMYDGNPPDTYITPDLYWDGEYALDLTRAVADTGLFDYSMWAWCGQQSWNDVDTVQRYLDALDQLESEYAGMRFIYQTGHTDGDDTSYLVRNNEMVRDYVDANAKILFDFADIERYDPDGVEHADTDDACGWCYTWCENHPADPDCINRPEDDSECQHSHGLNCVLKAKAFWWLAARLVGWDGTGGSEPETDGVPDGIWKDASMEAQAVSMNVYIQTYTTGSAVVVVSPDGVSCRAFIAESFDQGIEADDIGGLGYHISISFESDWNQATVTLSADGQAGAGYTIYRWFKAASTDAFPGIWKNEPQGGSQAAVNFYVQTYEAGSMVLIGTSDAVNYQVFLDSDKSDGFNVDSLSGASHLDGDFMDAQEGYATLTYYADEMPMYYTLYNWFAAPYAP